MVTNLVRRIALPREEVTTTNPLSITHHPTITSLLRIIRMLPVMNPLPTTSLLPTTLLSTIFPHLQPVDTITCPLLIPRSSTTHLLHLLTMTLTKHLRSRSLLRLTLGATTSTMMSKQQWGTLHSEVL
ncbi:hypothetical protein KC19_8G037300 [Ceratodon purpureus]|uniref:Uncharacterized protein n=1 Tax=Ceratodon purpureus TaxID=3225 RepID=A0A8T0GUU5_CERPU|nr:hypothetical protein KC19_8G037300 [Ceratodon purpureus]